MSKIDVIILTKNEEKHIERCIKSLQTIANHIFLVDSGSTDNTKEIAESLGAKVYEHPWINYATQFQWGLENCPIESEWVMRIDSDEYLEPALAKEIADKTPYLPNDVSGIYLKRKVYFKGKWIRYGGFYPHVLLRIWRAGKGRIEQRWMDEHIVLSEGSTVIYNENLVDYNLNDIGWWVSKHNSYATREMIDLMNSKYHFFDDDSALMDFDDPQAKRKRYLKERVYSRLPVGFRAFLYFNYRYFIKLGFLDGSKGFVFHFMQGFWYRLLVDVKVTEFEEKIKNIDLDIPALLERDYNVKL